MRWLLTSSSAPAVALGLIGLFAAPAAADAKVSSLDASTQAGEQAQASPQAGASADVKASEDSGLQDIIVTAQRRSENLQKAAIAITAVDSATLVRAGVTDTAQLTKVAPALQIATIGGAASTFYLRGVGNFTTNSLSDAAVSFNVDGVAIARSFSAQGVFYDLERVEVLKGPQGTLYGRNSTGGAVNVITAKPQAGLWGGFLNAEFGNFSSKKITGAVNVPLGEEGAVRIAGMFSDHDGYYSDGTGDDRTRAIRVQFSNRMTDTFKLTVGGDFAYQGGRGSGATVVGLDPDKRIGISSPQAGAIYSSSFAFLAGSFLHPLDNDAFNKNKFWGMYAQADIDTSVGQLTILPAYRNTQLFQRNYTGSFSYNERLKDDQVSIEARLSKDIGAISYIVGVYYLNETADERPSYNQQYFAGYATNVSKTNSYAGFGRLTFHVSDKLRATGGIRYTIDDKSADLRLKSAVVVCPAVFAGGACLGTPALPNTFDLPSTLTGAGGTIPAVQPWGTNGAIAVGSNIVKIAQKTFRKATYRAGVEYDLGPQSLLYASYETGFKSGGFFTTIDNPVYRPETITAITLGSKNRFFDNRLQLNLEAFRWMYKDQQVNHGKLDSTGNFTFVTENIGRTKIQGAEAELRAKATNSTTLSATIQYLDAKYSSFAYTTPVSAGTPVTGCPFVLSPTTSTYVIDCSGRRPPNAPEWTISGGFEQRVELANAGSLVFNVDARFQSSIYTGFEELDAQIQKRYATVDLQLTYKAPGSHFTIAGFANNLTDRNAVSFSLPQGRSPGLIAESLRPPRTFGVRVGYQY